MAHPELTGMLVINKPRGMVSKDVSRWLVKRLGKLHIGHVGTLDPLAEGVLPILLGSATRLQDFLLELPKTYLFDMTFGYETSTLDSEGEVIDQAPWDHISGASLRDSLELFRGEIEQVPPIYSAVKFKGKPLYEYARKNTAMDVPTETLARKVRVHKLELNRFEGGVASLEVTCSKGTYVRTLVKDIALHLGTRATMTRLIRSAAAGVSIDQSYTLESVEQSLNDLEGIMIPVGKFGIGLPRWTAVDEGAVSRLKNGMPIGMQIGDFLRSVEAKGLDISGFETSTPWLLLDISGRAFGLGCVRHGDKGQVLVNMKRGLQ